MRTPGAPVHPSKRSESYISIIPLTTTPERNRMPQTHSVPTPPLGAELSLIAFRKGKDMNPSYRLTAIGVSTISFCLFMALLLNFSTTPAWAQSASGTISGQVTDPSSAAVAGAEVKLVDAETNTSQT